MTEETEQRPQDGEAQQDNLTVTANHVAAVDNEAPTPCIAAGRRTKPARLTVNLDLPTYTSLVEVARREDVSVSWVVRRAIEALLDQDRTDPVGPARASSTASETRTGSRGIAPQ